MSSHPPTQVTPEVILRAEPGVKLRALLGLTRKAKLKMLQQYFFKVGHWHPLIVASRTETAVQGGGVSLLQISTFTNQDPSENRNCFKAAFMSCALPTGTLQQKNDPSYTFFQEMNIPLESFWGRKKGEVGGWRWQLAKH